MKLKFQRRPQTVEDARTVEHPLRKAAGNAWSQPEERCHVAMSARREAPCGHVSQKRGSMWPANGKARDVGLPKAVGAHIRTPCVLMSGTELKIVFGAGFQSILPHLPFRMGMPTLCY